MDDNSCYICTMCKLVYSSEEETRSHVCSKTNKDGELQVKTEQGVAITENCVEIGLVEFDHNAYDSVAPRTTIIMHENESVSYDELNGNVSIQFKHGDEYEIVEAGSLKRKRCTDNAFIRNKLVRDPYFKIDRHSYTFKDTLGDWDEKSTKYLITLIGLIPNAHFVLKCYHERRLGFWDQIQDRMISAGYNFTILQLRMRWRELFAKYRWTVNHNDLTKERKSFEYMQDMDNLFGVWTKESTEALLNLIEKWQKDNGSAKNKRIAYVTWERITHTLQAAGLKYNVYQVEGRWRNLVITYKSVIDHNMMPTVQPIRAAFQDKLAELIAYEPRRRKDYEKYKGKKVKLEKFPEQGMKHVIHLYKNNIEKFLDNSVKNAEVWESIKQSLDALNYHYSVMKIKEIFFATLKLYERVLQHNSIPGAIKREGSHFKELSEIYDAYGYWPHVKRRRKTLDEKQHRKYSLRLRESMQSWSTEESEALLKIFPDVLEKFNSQNSNATTDNELWVQVAEAFQNSGYTKRDIPEIATHIGLLRQGYWQKNNFPFNDLMKTLMAVEEALCYSPDVSKYTGDIEIYYWSHEAVDIMLDLYMRIQTLLPFSALTKEVYARISKEMKSMGYNYSNGDVGEEFRNLLGQFSVRKNKTDNIGRSKVPLFCKSKMEEVINLRERLSVTFTNGIKPIPLVDQEIILKYGIISAKQLFEFYVFDYQEQKDRMKVVILEIRKEIKRHLSKKPPAARKVCVQLLSFLINGTENTAFEDGIQELRQIWDLYNFEKILTDIMSECHNGSFQMARRLAHFEKTRQARVSQSESEDICILQLDDENDGIKKEIEEPAITPKLELNLDEDQIDIPNRTLYIDNELGIKTTVVSNPDSQVMISIDEMHDRHPNKGHSNFDDGEVFHVIQDPDDVDESFSADETPSSSYIDSEILLSEVRNVAFLTKKEEKLSLKNLRQRNSKKKEILDFLLHRIKEFI